MRTLAAAALAALALVACGGGDADMHPDGAGPRLVPVRHADGRVTEAFLPAEQLAAVDRDNPGLGALLGMPRCTVTTYALRYPTVGGAGEATDAAAALMVPGGSDPRCSGPRPVVVYTHGTQERRDFSMADVGGSQEASLVAATYAGQGFIVVAPNYAGYGGSSLPYHPYLVAEAEARQSVDALRVARQALPRVGAAASDKLFITGYSQGAHSAMATQRHAQLANLADVKFTAWSGMSGPYALSLLADAVFAGSPNLGGTLYVPMITTSYQRSYGAIYTTTTDVYTPRYAPIAESVFPGESSFEAAAAAGKIPLLQLFGSDYAAHGLPGPSTPELIALFGDVPLVSNAFRMQYLQDAAANPCSADLASPLACKPQNALRKALVLNDLRTYTPAVPTMLCGGGADPSVFFASTQATTAYLLGRGMPRSRLHVVDVDGAMTANQGFTEALDVFRALTMKTVTEATAGGIDPAMLVAGRYHVHLAQPACNVATRKFFEQQAFAP
jgi:hypothetical protein